MTWPRALGAAVALTLLAACASGGSTSTPATSGVAAPDGRFVWQDLVTTDAAAARQFYSALLGWQFDTTTQNGRPYAIAKTAAGPVGGILDIRDIKDATSQWLSYVVVGDVDQSVQQVQAAGGKVLVAPTAARAGRASVVADPQGAPIGLLDPARDVPPDPITPVPAHFFWREYLTQDAAKSVGFYKSLLGYDAASADARLGLEYHIFRRDGPRAGLVQLPAAASQVRPHWLPYILVDNPAALAAKATGLGGRVLLEPSAERRNGTLAIVADPTGGVVALQKFPL